VSTEVLNTLLILGAAQGLFLAILLATQQVNSTANNILAVAMLAFSIFILEGVYYARAYYEVFPHFIGVSKPLVFLFGPIIYLYAKTVSAGGQVFRKASLLHFIPCLLVTLYFLPFYAQDGATKLAFLHALMREGPPLDVAIIEQLQYPHGIIYMILTIRLLQRHYAQVKTTHSSVERINLLWLRNLTIGIAAVWVLVTGLNLLDVAGFELGEAESQLTPLAMSILVYCIGYMGLRQPEIFNAPPWRAAPARSERVQYAADDAPPLENHSGLPDTQKDSPAPSTAPVSQDEAFGYEKSGLTQVQAEALGQQLVRLMEEDQLFKRSQLTLQELADEMSISAHNLSEVINTQMRQNFYDFVNGYRVEEVKRRLRDPQSRHLTILALAEESGFNSKSAFNALFKKHTGQTPSHYRRQHVETT